jgi:2-(1,2-epoxy-1,2-dihydrophenyl)acetyl-CoA isomerase
MTEYQTLHIEQQENVLTVGLNRPKANAFNHLMVEELLGALKNAEKDASVRCVVLTGRGSFFSTGHDVGFIAEADTSISYRAHLERTYNRVVRLMRRMAKPIVGAINGPAVGAGLGIALATDVRWAAESASFIFGFTGIGLTTDAGTSLMLPMLMGLSRAMEMAFTNKPLSAEEALNVGLVSRVVDDKELQAEVADLAASIANGPTASLGLTKRAINRAMLHALDDSLEYESYLQEIASRTEDHKEGVAAFLEKRPPNFQGV